MQIPPQPLSRSESRRRRLDKNRNADTICTNPGCVRRRRAQPNPTQSNPTLQTSKVKSTNTQLHRELN
ncbi:MAG: hypothetical protein NZM35_09860, partial [Chitinophagales bacterium]|nr:hypothetical protein [Chitinophagales bacterium]MDW8419573.1 hypothetical protein [Chitinophagales bacterium]